MTHTHDDELTDQFTDELTQLIQKYAAKGACAFHQIAMSLTNETVMLLIDQFRKIDKTNAEKQENYAKGLKMLTDNMSKSVYLFNNVVAPVEHELD